MDPQHADALSQGRVTGGHHPPIAEPAQVLGRKEAEAAQPADRPGLATVLFGPDGLSRILDHGQAPAGRDLYD